MKKKKYKIDSKSKTYVTTSRMAINLAAPFAPGRLSNRGKSAAYEGASSRRRLATFQPSNDSQAAITACDGPMLRARSRDSMRNNPYAVSAGESWSANLIGLGIKPSSLVKERSLRDQIHELFSDWSDECDADEQTDFYGLQKLVADAIFEGGEAFVRVRPRRASDGMVVPFQLQVLESEMCPMELNRKENNGNETINGIEFDFRGKRVAYYFYRLHPGDVNQYKTNDLVRVSAENVYHVFPIKRPGQIRGVPRTAPAISRMWFLDQYDDAEMDRKKVAAMYAGFIETPQVEEMMELDDTESDTSPVATLEPGMMQVLLPGEKVTFSQPTEVGGTYEMFQYRNLLAISAAFGVPYGSMTGDMKRANYSSLRAALVEARRRLEQLQYSMIVQQFCKKVWYRFFDEAILAGALSLSDYETNWRQYVRVRWIAPRFEWVDPLKDIQAEKMAVDNLFKPRSQVQEEQGEDPRDMDQRIKEDQEREQELELVRRDPKGAEAGSTQPVDPEEVADQLDENEDNPGQEDQAA